MRRALVVVTLLGGAVGVAGADEPTGPVTAPAAPAAGAPDDDDEDHPPTATEAEREALRRAERQRPPPPPPSTPPSVEPDPPNPRTTRVTGALRGSLYLDSDQTTVWRAHAALAGDTGRFVFSGSATLDVVSSASVDVRSAPGGRVDVVTSASGRSSTVGRGGGGPTMSDRRIAVTAGGGWHDAEGHAVNLGIAYANERDYDSFGAGLHGSFDLLERTTTLLAGFSATASFVGSVIDPRFARQLLQLGWTAGVAQVASQRDVLRLRYDGAALSGYQASPYRAVRFGSWTAIGVPGGTLQFLGTLGAADGVPEVLPDRRVRHAATLDWLHSFTPRLALRTQAQVGADSWGVRSAAGRLELRVATERWRLFAAYRLYYQGPADFYRERYLQPPSAYAYYTADKELGEEMGQLASLGLARVLARPRRPAASRMLIEVALNLLHYRYPQFPLLGERTSGFLELGLTWEP